MARARKVTRTISSTIATVMFVDTVTAKVENYEMKFPGVYSDDNKLMKEVAKKAEGETLKPVTIISKRVVEALYGMDEQKFMELAEALPTRGKKEADENEVE